MSWIFFLMGLALQTFAGVDKVVRAKNTTATSRLAVIRDRAPQLLGKLFLASMAFGVLFEGGGRAIYGENTPQWLLVFEAIMNTTAAPFFAGGIGFLFNNLLGYIPWFKTYIEPEQE